MRKRISVEEEFQRDIQDATFRKEYEALGDEFSLARAMIKARARAKVTQKDIAIRMGTTQSSIARMESGRISTIKTLKKYAHALGMELDIRFIPSH